MAVCDRSYGHVAYTVDRSTAILLDGHFRPSDGHFPLIQWWSKPLVPAFSSYLPGAAMEGHLVGLLKWPLAAFSAQVRAFFSCKTFPRPVGRRRYIISYTLVQQCSLQSMMHSLQSMICSLQSMRCSLHFKYEVFTSLQSMMPIWQTSKYDAFTYMAFTSKYDAFT